ncbi:Hypothetical protein I595_3647 [Croceitalea dokdonensis DOKDO 023]|uniref:Uncharacterized protein n=1 Tax=Croceitalea dokdonensis DOKDO 023 TaxID=1300341 RepID=A0A0P7AR97_9FLAO|nr:Hypothetical protein I595_3647 [Croceitalea dokdonensis DOKDO 023]
MMILYSSAYLCAADGYFDRANIQCHYHTDKKEIPNCHFLRPDCS